MASNVASKVAVSDLAPDHLQAFDKALRRIVTADHTKYALAQIVDGLPTRDVYLSYGWNQPAIANRLEPSSDSVEMVQEFLENFMPGALYIESGLAQAYQDTSIGTRQFHLRLLEMVAVAFHTAAAFLFDSTNSKPYKCPDSKIQIKEPCEETNWLGDPFPTFLYHVDYMDHDQYPLGVADMVGYWAETEVFGGVVLFDRGESETECREAFLHPNAHYAIFQLSETQLAEFIDFVSNNNYNIHMPPNTLPIRSEKYARRVYPEESMQLHIFRNRYERKIWKPSPGHTVHPRRRLEDDPCIMDFMEEYEKKRTAASNTNSSTSTQNNSESTSESQL